MNSLIKEDILKVLSQATVFLENRDAELLEEISNHTIHNASVFQDKDSVTIATVVYALSRIVNRMGQIAPDVINHVKDAKDALLKDDIQTYENSIKELISIISTVDSRANYYVIHIINEAGIKKGSRIYEHGISIAQTADIFGISQWELMKYLGQTNIPDQFVEEVDIRTRIVKARELFGIKK